MKDSRILVSGHRGESTYHPENTMEAFRAAISYGVDMIETDIHMTADRIPVLRHDMVIPGIGNVCDHTLDELRRVKPDLPTLEEFLNLAVHTPDLLLNMEFKDIPEELKAEGIDKGVSSLPEDFAFACQDSALRMMEEAGLADRVYICSFSGKLVERAYLLKGKKFHYHGFYPWFIMGEMHVDPESFIELVCMQHRYLDKDGTVKKYPNPLCPKDWWETVSSKGMIPLAAPSLQSYENFDQAFAYGAKAVNTNDPKGMIGHLQLL